MAPDVEPTEVAPIALPYRIVDGATGAAVSDDEFYTRALAARVVYVAEKHTSPHDHAVQRDVLDAISSRTTSVAIGLEMVKRPFQKWLSDYVSGRIDEEKFIEKSEWKRRWGYNFGLYRPLFEICRERGLAAHALNARDEITRGVARHGIDALDEVDRAAIPDLDLNVERHKKYVKEVFDSHEMGAMTFENFYTAQVIWDETMAYEVANAINADDAPQILVVFAGRGHIQYGDGIPDRAARRGAQPYVSVLPIIADDKEVAELVASKAATFLWVMTVESDTK